MAQRCKTCAHPSAKEIDKLILANLAYTRIGSEFNLNAKSVEYHAKHHLKPIIDQANEQAKVTVVKKIAHYREEVNYSALEKIKFLQNSLLNDLDSTQTLQERILLYREFRASVSEESKLCGLYRKEPVKVEEIDQLRKALQNLSVRLGTDYRTELSLFLEDFSYNLRVDFKAILEKELAELESEFSNNSGI